MALKLKPPRLADRFLVWYCHPDLLEEIQGDAYELYFRKAQVNKRKADWLFIWNVIRFFRWRNIRRRRLQHHYSNSFDMLQNIFKVAIRNFLRQPRHSVLNVAGLAVSFTAALLIGLWIAHEKSFDKFHQQSDHIFHIMSHVETDGTIDTYPAAQASIDLSSVPEISEKAVVITGNRWPNELCFRPEGKLNECIYLSGIFSEKTFFSMFNFPIISGDPHPLAKPTDIAISERMATTLYGVENPLGKTIKIDDHFPVTIAAVFKDVPVNSSLQFDFVLPTEVFARMRGLEFSAFQNDFYEVYFKTNTSVTPEELTAKLNNTAVLTESLRNDKVTYSAQPLIDIRLKGEFVNGINTGGRIRYVNLFIVVALLVVIMSVINFINLSTARATTRSREIGIRKVTGAQRFSIVLQFMGESFLVVVVAVVISVVCVQLALPLFNSLIGETLSVTIFNASVVGYVLFFLLVITLAAGLYPSLVMSSFQPAQVLKGSLASLRGGGLHLRKVLLVVQVTFSLGIIIFTGVLFLQLSFIQNKNLGYDHEHIIHIEPTYRLLKQFDAFKNELLTHPQIQQVAATASDPVDLTYQVTDVRWPGMAEDKTAAFKLLGASEDVLKTFDIQVLDGRMWGSKPVDSVRQEILVSESAVARMNLKTPLGSTIQIGNSECVIIGVINNFHTASLKQEQLPVVLYRHETTQCSRLYVKYTPGTTTEAMTALSKVYKKFEPDFTLKYDFVDEAFDKMYKTERSAALMLVFFTIIALVIAVVGVVGLATYNVLRRKKEIGIKRVFGASMIQIFGMLSKEFVLLIGVAGLAAFPFAWYSTNRWLSDYAYRINMPWWIFVAAFILIMFSTLLLILVQGLKAIRTNPTVILRSE